MITWSRPWRLRSSRMRAWISSICSRWRRSTSSTTAITVVETAPPSPTIVTPSLAMALDLKPLAPADPPEPAQPIVAVAPLLLVAGNVTEIISVLVHRELLERTADVAPVGREHVVHGHDAARAEQRIIVAHVEKRLGVAVVAVDEDETAAARGRRRQPGQGVGRPAPDDGDAVPDGGDLRGENLIDLVSAPRRRVVPGIDRNQCLAEAAAEIV